MRQSRPASTQFLLTASHPCPYLDGRVERKLFTQLNDRETADTLNSRLTAQGFRRSRNVIYRPACEECAACMSARIRVADFKPTRSHRKILARNADIRRDSASPWATEEQFELFRRYLRSRHSSGGMTDMDIFEFAAMMEETSVQSQVVQYVLTSDDGGKRLVGVCLTDVLDDALSMMYSFFDTSEPRRSLGTHIILDHIDVARRSGLSHVYLGYWIPGAPKMDYKARFSGFEIFHREKWIRPKDPIREPPNTSPPENDDIVRQVNRISLPATANARTT